jgi:hypothetical protein
MSFFFEFWAEEGDLALTDDGELFASYKGGHVHLGPIVDDYGQPADPPEGHEAEFAVLLDLWKDAHAWDPKAEANDAHRAGLKGGI